MEISVTQIGNSRGIKIPKKVLEEYQIGDTIELKLKKNHIEIRPVDKPRENWKRKFEELVNDPNEEQMIPDV